MRREQASRLLKELRRGIEALRDGQLDVADQVAYALSGLLEGTGSDDDDLLAHEAVEEYLTCLARDPRDWERPASYFNALVHHLSTSRTDQESSE